MAAYASLVSLMNTLNNIQIHPRVSTFFDPKQIQSLHKTITFLLDFTESCNSHGDSREEENLGSRIASNARAAEDVIESHVANQILAGTSDLIDLEKEIEDLNFVEEKVMEFRGALKFKDDQTSHSIAASSKTATMKKDFVVGFDEKLIQIMDRLTGQQLGLEIVPVVCMGGIGKTTLAKCVNDNLLIVESFDVRAWVIISQEYSVKNVLSELLSCVGALGETGLITEDHELGLKLYQTLSGRRYLIVLDDMWSIEAWDKIKIFFPDNGQRSRVVITTRISSVATHLSSLPFEMNFLDEDQSWKLFCGNVFLENGCPPELEETGKKIVRECKGLPLSIVVIGGILRNSRSTRDYWEKFAIDLNSILMSGNDEHYFTILSLSYNHLPAHLKPCFLYMGGFQEDEEIWVSQLVKLFVAEGFLKPKEGQTLEDVAEDYLNDLVDRNLILVDSWKLNGKIKYCKMHDLVREVCLKIGVTENIFYGTRRLHIPTSSSWELPIVFDRRNFLFDGRNFVLDGRIPKEKNRSEVSYAFPSTSLALARTFLFDEGPLSFKSRFLRVLIFFEFESLEDISQHVNLRYLNWSLKHKSPHYKLPSSISLLWNVHTLIFRESFLRMDAPPEIWYMRQLRHLQLYMLFLPDPPPSDKVEQQDDALLPNLQTLSTLANFSFTEEVCKRIPNIKKLRVTYTDLFGKECQGKCYYHLGHLYKLQSLYCSFGVPERGDLLQSLVFLSSLRKLSFFRCHLHWEDLNTFGFSLPHLEILKLYSDAVEGPEWDCVEGAFPRLKFLYIEYVDLITWTADCCDFFPVLENLHLGYLFNLENIPSCIGEIQTLENLRVDCCNLSAAISSLEILEEQLSFGNEDLQLVLTLSSDGEEESFMEKVAIKNFTGKNFKLV